MQNECPWKILREEIYESFPIFTLKKSVRVNPASGAAIEFVRIEGLDWVNTLAFTEKNELILVRQYRHGSEEYTLELPGGCVEKDENDPSKSGARELLEETGYQAGPIEYLGMLSPNPAMYAMKNYFYVATNCKSVAKQTLDSGEDIKVVVKPYVEVLEDIKSGKMNHGMCAAGIGLFEIKKHKTG